MSNYFWNIDEYSMLSQAMLGLIDKRLRQATGNQSEYFEGLLPFRTIVFSII